MSKPLWMTGRARIGSLGLCEGRRKDDRLSLFDSTAAVTERPKSTLYHLDRSLALSRIYGGFVRPGIGEP